MLTKPLSTSTPPMTFIAHVDKATLPVPLPPFFETPVAKENSIELLEQLHALKDDVFILDDGEYLSLA